MNNTLKNTGLLIIPFFIHLNTCLMYAQYHANVESVVLSSTDGSGIPVPSLKPNNRPSIVLIVADDLGYGDLESYGDYALVPTPNMDRLAERGVRFTDAYATAPVCGPSRYGFMTGIYQQRLGVFDNRDAWGVIPEPDNRIPEGVSVFNEPLAEAGYVTGIVGKWNLPNYPNTTFCETHSVIHFGADYFPDETGHFIGVDEPVARSSSKIPPFWGPLREGDEYLTDRLGRQAVDFINRHSGQPFFLYLGFNAPHSPLQAKKSHRESVAHLPSEALRFYAAMVLSFDENVGLILDALEENGLTENTLVVLTSDQGPSMAFNVGWPEDWPRELLGSAGPLSGHKGQLLEGGIRVPMLLSWPKHIPQGGTYNEYVSLLDLFPTFTAAGQVPLEKIPQADRLDGVNLLPYLVGVATGAPHERLFWLIGNNAAIRQGDWKLRVHNHRASLFNLVQDIGEKNDVASQYPEIVSELTNHLKDFQAELPEKANPAR